MFSLQGDFKDCKQKLIIVLERLSTANIKVNWDKCRLFVTELNYLGHVICEKWLLPCQEKIQTIRKAIAPKNTSELKSFLRLMNYYNKFIPRLSVKLYCLYNLLKRNVKFVWDENCNKAFEDSKKLLMDANILEFYDPKKTISVVSDVSSYGLGGVISHFIDGWKNQLVLLRFL